MRGENALIPELCRTNMVPGPRLVLAARAWLRTARLGGFGLQATASELQECRDPKKVEADREREEDPGSILCDAELRLPAR